MDLNIKTVAKNSIALGSIQVANYLLPLVIVPYIVRVIGPGKYGTLAFVQAFIQYFILFTDYGYSFTGAREIALKRDNIMELSTFYSSVMITKVIFLFLSIVILIILCIFIPFFSRYTFLYFATFGIVIGNVLFPMFVFKGLEEMKYISVLSLSAKVVSIVAILILVKSVDDYIYIPLIYSVTQTISGLISLYLIHHSFHVRFLRVDLEKLKYNIQNGRRVFFSSIAINLYTSTNIVILGVFATNEIVGFYAAGEKIVRAISGMWSPITQSFLPHFIQIAKTSYVRSINLLTFLGKYVIVIGTAVSICIYIFAPLITHVLLGPKFLESIYVIQILSTLPLILGITLFFGDLFLFGFGFITEWSKMIITISLCSIILTFSLVGILHYQYVGMSISILITESMIMIASLKLFFKKKNYMAYANTITTRS